MKGDEYLVTTTVNGHVLKSVWHTDDPLELDFPVYWRLVMTGEQVQIQNLTGDCIQVDSQILIDGRKVLLPEIPGEPRRVKLQLKKLKKIHPAFLPDVDPRVKYMPSEFFISAGIRDCLIRFQALKKSYKAMIERTPIFQLQQEGNGFHVVSFQKGVRFKVQGENWMPIVPGTPLVLSPKQIVEGAFFWGSFWWRINQVPTPQLPTASELAEDAAEQEGLPLRAIGRTIGGIFLLAVLGMRFSYYFNEYTAPKPVVIETKVELRKPKVIPKVFNQPKVEIPKPKPKPKPIPKPKAKAPPKKKSPPPRKKKPTSQVKKTPVSQPKRLPPKTIVRPPVSIQIPPRVARPRPIVQVAPPPPKVDPKVALSKSLNFLSAVPIKNVQVLAHMPSEKLTSRYQNVGTDGAVSSSAKASVLNNMGPQSVAEGLITTTGARNVSSSVALAGGGKSLNEVQGKVSFSNLYGSGSGEALGELVGSTATNISGPGKLSDAAIEKTLAKYTQKFQQCYEKALLTNPGLSGAVQMQWTIQVGGGVSGAQIVRSAMNHAILHSCLVREISKIVFPSPKGGPVVVKKPMNFSSSSI